MARKINNTNNIKIVDSKKATISSPFNMMNKDHKKSLKQKITATLRKVYFI